MRKVGSTRESTWPRIRAAGVDLLYEFGYDAMNTRRLAESADLTSSALYYHFKSKEDFLFRLLSDLLEEIVDDLESALAATPESDPVARLDTFVRILVKWHVTRHKETFIASIETRALSRDRHLAYSELRDRFDLNLHKILAQGEESGDFAVIDVTLTSASLLAMLTAISGWYDPAGPLGLEEITAGYVELARRLAGVVTST
ncbi:TetR/AcrR family transcriptional regulator [Gordonia sp. i37]|uniref:TetR/AcrR family transcriptional regulator n=1 Tax=Gordonia sp. i37 TaxID=1961707 RepID=UPI0009AC0707|nr:TetR/AcrR family transcriptional regulator [Gordonia sp. i37]OPX05669.1 TetR family transcriptional regulator [Gordonia sp. i37]